MPTIKAALRLRVIYAAKIRPLLYISPNIAIARPSLKNISSPNWMVICHDQSSYILINHDESPVFIMKNH